MSDITGMLDRLNRIAVRPVDDDRGRAARFVIRNRRNAGEDDETIAELLDMLGLADDTPTRDVGNVHIVRPNFSTRGRK